MGDKGEPMGTPKVCLNVKLLNVKKVKVKTNLIAIINSVKGRQVLCSIKLHRSARLEMLDPEEHS